MEKMGPLKCFLVLDDIVKKLGHSAFIVINFRTAFKFRYLQFSNKRKIKIDLTRRHRLKTIAPRLDVCRSDTR